MLVKSNYFHHKICPMFVSMVVLLNQGLLMLHLFLVKKAIIKKSVKNLYHRISKDKVKELNTSIGPVLELQGAPSDSYAKMNLGISKLQAMEVSNRGFNVIVRPTNYQM